MKAHALKSKWLPFLAKRMMKKVLKNGHENFARKFFLRFEHKMEAKNILR